MRTRASLSVNSTVFSIRSLPRSTTTLHLVARVMRAEQVLQLHLRGHRMAVDFDDRVSGLEARHDRRANSVARRRSRPDRQTCRPRFMLMPSRPGCRSSPFSSRGSTWLMSASGTAKPMPESYHSTPANSSLAIGDIGTSTPSTRPRISTSGPP